MWKLFDTHCHPQMNKIKDFNYLINNFFYNWGKYLNIIWTNIEDNKNIIKLCKNLKNVFLSIWIHPNDIWWLDINKSIIELEQLYLKNRDKIIAIWECWLDYYWLEKNYKDSSLNISKSERIIKLQNIDSIKIKQEDFFIAQINLAKKFDLPLVIHSRDSNDNVLKILKKINFKNFVLHSYTWDYNFLKKIINFSDICKIWFSWILTFKNANILQDTIKNIDISKIIVETDCPYLTPTPFRWKEENEPLYIKYIIEKISEIKNIDYELCKNKIFNNSIEFFFNN